MSVPEIPFTKVGGIFTYYLFTIHFLLKILELDFWKATVLKIEQIPQITDKCNIPYLINEFFIKKFNAKPLEYNKYSF